MERYLIGLVFEPFQGPDMFTKESEQRKYEHRDLLNSLQGLWIITN